ncbi:pentatricopeptide repeat-containing protein At4g04790, mitochondrial-like isoform X2 [Macadamia integrifolia]|uniref:pentatricopeptide repeat-containing protein At4g04790, mitochondrial-like isoform X2 n=1 Tax=Macadamia integrifolia TaxID=60698 RepID=UPI001C52BDC5|nr:pentatricopeptide repeat-containing protein At4g04790, mitochondrial-like isoform X2 [Macadamia integrifolia]
MCGSKVKNLSSLFGSALKKSSKKSIPSSGTTYSSEIVDKPPKGLLKVSSKAACRSKKSALNTSSKLALDTLSAESQSVNSVDFKKLLSVEISSLLCGSTVTQSSNSLVLSAPDETESLEKVLDIPWISNISNASVSSRRKEISRHRKQRWIFKNSQTRRFNRLVKMCAEKLGTDATLEVFGKLGRETGVKEYKALMEHCIQKARDSEDDEVSLHEIHKAFQLFRTMREQGFQIEENIYGPFLMYLIDMGMVEEFHFFSRIIRDENPYSISRLGYYEMLLWIRVDDESKVQELCNFVGLDNEGDRYSLAENYLLALCENDRLKEVLQLSEVLDITKVSSLHCVASIFNSLGRLLLENLAEKFILAFKTCESGAKNMSDFIYYYATSMPNLAVDDVILKFKFLHEKLEVAPSSTSYEKLIVYCCDSLKVHAALNLVDQMFQLGLTLSIDSFNSILHASEEACELELVHPIYSVMRHHNLNPNAETFRMMINLCAKMRDFQSAYKMLKELEDLNLVPSSNMYNAIMAGYFREKNISGGLMVLKQMERAGVKPDTQTFSFLIGNCESEEDIKKYCEEMQHAGVQATKHIYMALINAYVHCGQYEKAKQVVLEQGIPVKNINEIKSVLVSALATSGQTVDALKIYEEIKQADCIVEPKAILNLIEHIQTEGELSRMFELLRELNDLVMWFDGCGRVVQYCIRYKHLSSAVDLLKQLKDKDELGTDAVLDQAFCQISEMEPTDLQIGLDLLQALRDELGILPSRTSLDFLLSSCVNAKDPRSARLIYDEYQKVGLPYNALTYLRMYQVLLASGEHTSTRNMLKKIPQDDPHVRHVIMACQKVYSNYKSVKKKKK